MPGAERGRFTIVLDAMGGDFSPKNEVLGAAAAIKAKPGFDVILVGKADAIERELSALPSRDRISIQDASQVIGMEDEPVAALKQKTDSSIVRGLALVNDRKADAFVSAGNTGAVMSGATLLLGRIAGVSRPTIGSLFPRASGGFSLLFDVGATVDSKAIHLRECAIMGSIFSREMLGVADPRVAILSVGEEPTKGNALVFETADLLRATPVNFIGNVEGRDILKDTADVIVCDGFVGNIVLKFAESVLTVLRQRIRAFAATGLIPKLVAGIIAPTLRKVLKDFDYQEYGGVPLLGVKHVTIIGHGSSTPKALSNMVLKAVEMLEKGINDRMADALRPTSNPSLKSSEA